MPEGPEVRRHADMLHEALAGKTIVELAARTKLSKAWLTERPNAFPGQRVLAVRSHGKNLVGIVEQNRYFYTHLLMWGRWLILPEPPERDRRERARIVADDGTSAILLSAPVFEVGEATHGDPFSEHPYLQKLGPDVLPYPEQGPFAESCFVERMLTPANRVRDVGAVLLDQTVCAGIGNYLRAEILFVCRISPFRTVDSLGASEVAHLCREIPALSDRAYRHRGVTVTPDDLARLKEERALRYPNSISETGGGHYVFRRTNLPCLVCSTPIRQKKQVTYRSEEGEEKERIIFYCPVCQGVGT